MKLFISHSTQDKWIARKLAADLEGVGAETFLDAKDIKTGESIDDTVQEHLKGWDEILILLSPAALVSSWVMMEVGGAKVLGLRMIPVLLQIGPNDLPPPLSKGLTRNLNEVDLYVEEVRQRVVEAGPEEARASEAELALRAAAGENVGMLTGGIAERLSAMPLTELSAAVDAAEEKATAEGRPTLAEGDTVKIPDQPQETYLTPYGMSISWTEDMTAQAGKTAVVTVAHRDRTVRLDVDATKWWAMDWLAPAGK